MDNELHRGKPPITDQQREVARLLAQGISKYDIAARYSTLSKGNIDEWLHSHESFKDLLQMEVNKLQTSGVRGFSRMLMETNDAISQVVKIMRTSQKEENILKAADKILDRTIPKRTSNENNTTHTFSPEAIAALDRLNNSIKDIQGQRVEDVQLTMEASITPAGQVRYGQEALAERGVDLSDAPDGPDQVGINGDTSKCRGKVSQIGSLDKIEGCEDPRFKDELDDV